MYPAHTDFQIVIIELPKAPIDLGEVETLSEKWFYLLEQPQTLAQKEVTRKMSEPKEISMAADALKKINYTPEELIEIEKREKYAISEKENLIWAQEIAFEEGMQQGRVQQNIRSIINILTSKYGQISAPLKTDIEQLGDLQLLDQAIIHASTVSTIDAFASWLKDHQS